MREMKALVGDIGGTNARFALVESGTVTLQDIQVLPVKDYDNLDTAIETYLHSIGISSLSRICIAVACPTEEDRIRLTNSHWTFSKQAVKARFKADVFKVVNDFTAMALGVRHVSPEQRIQVGGQVAHPDRPLLVMGPGTGLGVSALVPTPVGWVPLAAEGGHVDLAPVDAREWLVLKHLRERFGRVSAERALCGDGLENIYQALLTRDGLSRSPMKAAEITAAALSGTDSLAGETLDCFCQWLGRVAGDAALTLGALGGVYLCGGILPRVLPYFQQSTFRAAFEEKGRMRHFLEPVPVWVVTEPYTGLIGAAAAVDNDAVL